MTVGRLGARRPSSAGRGFAGERLHRVAGFVACAVAFSTFALADQRPGEAAVTRYRQTTRLFPNATPGGAPVQLLTRGYLDDSCMVVPKAACMAAANPLRVRPEASAQALAMWVLAAKKGDLPGFNATGFEKVDWEVGPGPGTPAVADSADPPEPPGEPDDPCDPDAPGGVGPDTKWRIDIALDQATIIEAKDWRRQAVVANQLNCYIQRASERQVAFQVNRELNDIGWVGSYAAPRLGATAGKVWCTWAPGGDPLTRGHLYFAPLAVVQTDLSIPREVEQRCHPDPSRGFDPVLDPALAAKLAELLAAALAAAAAAAAAAWLRGRLAPVPVATYQVATAGQQVHYDLAALQLPDRPRTLRVDYGHGGAPGVFSIPAGTGTTVIRATTTFPNVSGRYIQRISVGPSSVLQLEPGAAAEPEEETYLETVTDIGVC